MNGPAGVIDMTPSIVLVLAIGVCFATGVYLLLERSLTRVLLGFILMGNGANLLFLVAGGRAGGAPIVGTTPDDEMSDPLVQAMVLTAIVITLGLTAFVLAMAYRSWQLHGHDEVQDDLEDRRVSERMARSGVRDRADEGATDLDVEAAEARDETEAAPPSADDPDAAADAPVDGGPLPSEDDPAEESAAADRPGGGPR
jgi:multicomponent Na+:H+ antiporter subunit C